MYPAKISRIIFNYNKLRVRFHVAFESDVHREFDYENKVYTSINNVGYLTLEVTQDKGSINDKSRSLMITEKSMFSIINFLNKTIDNLYKEDIYAYDNSRLVIYSDIADKCRVISRTPYGILMSKPSIIYDANDIAYEGITLFINNTANIVELPIDMLEALRYTLLKVDFVLYSQALMNYYITYYKINDDNPYNNNQQKQQTRNNRPVIDWTTKDDNPQTMTKFVKRENQFDKLLNP